MPTTRDDLIADWRKRLADASAVSHEASARPAWLTRLRVRLYRFLLSLYEGGEWNGPQLPEDESTQPVSSSEATDTDLSLSGKPAKSTDQIRHALSAIAGAREHPLRSGTLTGDLLSAGWIVVASSSGHVRTDRLADLLREAGIWSRISIRGDDRLVEVRARDRERAFSLLAENAEVLRGRDNRGQFEGINFLVGLVTVTVLYAPLATLYILWPLKQALDQGDLTVATARSIAPFFFLGWAGCIVLYCVYGAWQRARQR